MLDWVQEVINVSLWVGLVLIVLKEKAVRPPMKKASLD